MAVVGMLANLATGLTIDAYGPVCDNAGGIAEMAELPGEVVYLCMYVCMHLCICNEVDLHIYTYEPMICMYVCMVL